MINSLKIKASKHIQYLIYRIYWMYISIYQTDYPIQSINLKLAYPIEIDTRYSLLPGWLLST
jgi:hypothetical protein